MTREKRRERGMETERAERPLLRLSPENPLVLGALLALFVALVVVSLKVGSGSTRHVIEESDVGEITRRPIVATHDFTFEQLDEERLRRAQEEARRRVQPVWDHDPSLREQTVERVGRAFQGMRRELRLAAQEQALRQTPPLPADEDANATEEPREPPAPPDEEEREGAPPATIGLALLDREARIEVASSPATLEAFIRQLQRGIDEPALHALAADGFSEETEHLLRRLILVTMERRIVPDRQVLLAESEEGILLRTLLRRGEMQERRVRDFDAFLDASDIGDFIDQQLSLERPRVEDEELLQALRSVARAMVTVNTTYNESETRSRRDAAADAVSAGRRVQDFRRGQVILDAGRIIDADTVAIVSQLNKTMEGGPSRAWTFLSLAVLVLLITLPLAAFSLRELRYFSKRVRDLMMMGTLLILHLLITRATSFLASAVVEQGTQLPLEAFFVLAPFATGAMLVRILTTAENSLVYALIYALLTGIIFEFDLSYVTYAFVAGITGSAAVGTSRSRGEVLRAGVMVGVLMSLIAIALGLYQGTLSGDAIGAVALLALLSGIFSALLVFAITPLVEGLFSYTTSFRLLELSDLNHPALRELVLHAPGSYQHSVAVGQLVEAGCDAVGADSLLGRVGAIFHDIGKVKNPRYFGENNDPREGNPHDRLSPHMSALILKAHVKDGVEIARQHKLPPEIIDFIREHHGTDRMKSFYHKALQENDAVDEMDFRYPGPKPQSRETAICLLADQVEAATRSLPDRSPHKIIALVNQIFNSAFADGQLDSCDLTLRDLDLVAEAFLSRLKAIHHQRPAYPDLERTRNPGAQEPRGGERGTGPSPAVQGVEAAGKGGEATRGAGDASAADASKDATPGEGARPQADDTKRDTPSQGKAGDAGPESARQGSSPEGKGGGEAAAEGDAGRHASPKEGDSDTGGREDGAGDSEHVNASESGEDLRVVDEHEVPALRRLGVSSDGRGGGRSGR